MLTSESTIWPATNSVGGVLIPMTMNPTTKLMGAAFAAVAMIMTATLGYVSTQPDGMEKLRTFSSELELRHFLMREKPDLDDIRMPMGPGSQLTDSQLETSGSYSSTNIQVAGVDEEDTVKTDGAFIYSATSSNVTIVRAFPPSSLQVVSVVPADDFAPDENGSRTAIEGIYVLGDRLIVIANSCFTDYWRGMNDASEYKPPRVTVAVYDIGNRGNPTLAHSNAVSGFYLSSRMIGNCVYLVTQANIWVGYDELALPSTWEGDVQSQVEATDIRYDPETRQAGSFLNILAVEADTGEHELMPIVAGSASTLYMSRSAMYITMQKYESTTEWVDGVERPVVTSSAKTTIYRIDVDSLSMSVAGEGNVKGWLLNQFSMDEHSSHLRVATTTGWNPLENAVYVLNDDLDIVGRLEGLAPSERIYSSRFVGDSLYMVTFRQMDPLFVIDLKDPTNPSVIGELKIPGFSRYLHPVDEGHVLGIGLESGYLKVSLFNVSDPENPREQSKYVCDDNWWYSNTLYEHKAVLFDLERELLVLPGYGISYENESYDYNHTSGALVLRVSVSEGISLRGVVSNESADWHSTWETFSRSLFIGEYLYTVSTMSILVHSLEDLSFIERLVYGDSEHHDWYAL